MLATPLYIPAQKLEMLHCFDKKEGKVGKTSAVYGINILFAPIVAKRFIRVNTPKSPPSSRKAGDIFAMGFFNLNHVACPDSALTKAPSFPSLVFV